MTRSRWALRRAAHLLLPVVILAASPQPARSGEGCDPRRAETDVREVFASYQDALVRGDGALAHRLVDEGTLRYFEGLKRAALEGTESEVKERPFVDRLLVVSMRHALAPEVIETLTFERLIATAMTEGWIQPETVAGLEMGAVSVAGDEATGEPVNTSLPAIATPEPSAPGEPAPEGDATALAVSYRFVCEGGEWKFRFGSLVDQLDRLVTELTRQLGAEEDALIFSLVEAFTGEKVLPEIWQPVRPGGPPG
jgi:hypothetical protein